MTPAGFPHSDIHGSQPACGSPWLFAACHVLHRLPAPRHPPCALTALDQFPISPCPMQSGENQVRSHPATHLKRSTFPFTRIVKKLRGPVGQPQPLRLVRPAPGAGAAKLRIEVRIRTVRPESLFGPEGLTRSSRKEVIQPQVPLRLPCYDFAPVIELAFGRCLPCGLAHGLRALPTPMA